MAEVIYSELDHNPSFSGLAEILPDVSYSAAWPELKMTLIVPQAAQRLDDGRRYPVILFVQGSAWTSPNIYYEIPQLSQFAQKGYIVATITHRSALDGHRAPAFLEDVKTAIRFLREKADTYKVDVRRIGIWGTSSGGNTALLVGLTGDDPTYRTGEYPDQSDHVRVVVDCFGPADTPRLLEGALRQAGDQPLDEENQKLFLGLLGQTPEEQKERLSLMNPIEKIADKPYPPFLLIHGDADPVVPYEQSEKMAEALAHHGIHTELIRVRGAEHEGSFWSQELLKKIWDFIGRLL